MRDGWEERGKQEVENWKSTLHGLLGDDDSEWMTTLRATVNKADVIKFYPIYKVPPGRAWSRGRCLVIGDAAHAMPPHSSQGFSMALEDVFLFSKLLQSNYGKIKDGLAMEMAVTSGLWVYKTAGLERLGLGQRDLTYDVDEEQFP
ncbi:uncharacterized protein BROUX77_006789 [Berkeleyomyces rouxiae]|uniref:uncharacterized protein n=1 Tax=Berkeleyomyces rouxiae TaxID=2035830 RepID=UPI003B7D45D5